MIKAENLTKKYGSKTVFSSLSFEIEENVCTVITGESGIGKTTLIRCIAGLEKPDSGCVHGLENKRLSFVFQENRLIEGISVLDNILCVAPDKERAVRLLSAAGLSAEATVKAGKLSGGMKRRLSIVRCLAYGGDVFFLDEPLRELDRENEEKMLKLIKSELTGKTVLLITHDRHQAEFLSDRELRFEGSPMNRAN